MSRVLVTGARGFVGRNVVATLLRGGFDVVGTDVAPGAPEGPASGFEPCDLLDERSRRDLVARLRPTHLVHLAWTAEPGVYWRSPANLQWAAASLDLVRTFRDGGGVRAVGVGSCAEYGWGPQRFSENSTPCAPATLYGAAKDATRRLLEMFGREHDLSFAWARLFFLYGPGEKPGRLVSDAIAALRSGTPFPTSAGTQRRDFLHVDDVAAALCALLASDVTGAVNVASGTAVPVREILEHVAASTGRADLLRFGERPLSATEPAIIEGDATRLTREVGFRPTFDIAAGLRDTVARTP